MILRLALIERGAEQGDVSVPVSIEWTETELRQASPTWGHVGPSAAVLAHSNTCSRA